MPGSSHNIFSRKIVAKTESETISNTESKIAFKTSPKTALKPLIFRTFPTICKISIFSALFILKVHTTELAAGSLTECYHCRSFDCQNLSKTTCESQITIRTKKDKFLRCVQKLWSDYLIGLSSTLRTTLIS